MLTRANAIGVNYLKPSSADIVEKSYYTIKGEDSCKYLEHIIPDCGQKPKTTVIRRKFSGRRSLIDCAQKEHTALALAEPTIMTVEASANAKVFLETYFNSLNTILMSRLERRTQLERWLHCQDLDLVSREKCRKDWIYKESCHLRLSRSLSICSRRAALSNSNAALSKFNLLRVLGKGSFGTVCFVQELGDRSHNTREGSETSLESRALSDQFFTNSQKKKRKFTIYKKSSSVELIQQRRQPKMPSVYAMKVIQKSETIKNAQEGHIRAERDFLVSAAKSKWIVNLHASFQDQANLYLVMEYMAGGDFLSLLIKQDILTEAETRWYVAEMVMCIEAVHQLRWIHRDVKPDNFLISSSGHLKIADFGLAFDGHWSHDQNYYHSQRYSVLQKLNIPVTGDKYDIELIQSKMTEPDFDEAVYLNHKERYATLLHDPDSSDTLECESLLQWRDKVGRRAFAKSLVGTSQYMAPEIIEGQDYDGRCDWWSVGIILYECLFGHTPFNAKDRENTKRMILSHSTTLRLPPRNQNRPYQTVSKASLDLIKALLTTREERLSSNAYRQNDVGHIRCHSYLIKSRTESHGKFVYADDATAIKSHKFFSKIDWNTLHLTRPPMVPRLKDSIDTRYFDEPSNDGGLELFSPRTDSDMELADGAHEAHQLDGYGPEIDLKTRPRDRILRDELYRRDAMKLRKRNAFLGYTYHRPPTVRPSIIGVV